MSNSPPAKIQNALRRHEAARILAQNFDTLYVAIDVVWVDERFLTLLGDLRAEGEAKEAEQTSKITLADGSDTWRFNVLPYGMRGYSFILESQEMVLRLTSSLTSISRPNVYAELRSETLWRLTPELCIERIKRLLEEVGAEILSIKPSRVDLCVDVLVREKVFTPDLMPLLVTQAADLEPRYSRRKFSGYTVGKGAIKARLYDKPLEIKHKSHKDWMYGIWGLDRVPPGHKVVRVEYELRREVIKSLGINTIDDLFTEQLALWAYCSEKWLSAKDCPEKQNHCRKTLPWWEIVQRGFAGERRPQPLVRSKAVNRDIRQTIQQLVGQWVRLMALMDERQDELGEQSIELSQKVDPLLSMIEAYGPDAHELFIRKLKKKAKFERAADMIEESLAKRRAERQAQATDEPREPPH